MVNLLDRLTAALADRYRIERELGAGGMATVYLAEDLKHQRKVAVKVVRPELSAILGAERFLGALSRDDPARVPVVQTRCPEVPRPPRPALPRGEALDQGPSRRARDVDRDDLAQPLQNGPTLDPLGPERQDPRPIRCGAERGRRQGDRRGRLGQHRLQAARVGHGPGEQVVGRRPDPVPPHGLAADAQGRGQSPARHGRGAVAAASHECPTRLVSFPPRPLAVEDAGSSTGSRGPWQADGWSPIGREVTSISKHRVSGCRAPWPRLRRRPHRPLGSCRYGGP